MRVLLIDPPFRRFTRFANIYFPLGLGYLATAVRENGFEVRILDVDVIRRTVDLDLSDEYRRLQLYVDALKDDKHKAWQDVVDALKDYEPEIIGITAMTMKFGSVLKVAQICKEVFPDRKVIVGGPHATINPAQVLSSPHIDYAVSGEGERILPNLLRALASQGDLGEMNGVSYKMNGEIFHNKPAELIKNLDEISFPARDLLMHRENYTTEDMGVMMAYRGCPFNCSYCFHPWGRTVRNRSIGNIIQEIKHVKETYGTKQFDFADDTFTVNRKFTVTLCEEIILERLNINWACSTRVDRIDDELLKIMKKAGCNLIKIGVETGSENVLKETQKGVTLDQIRMAAKLLNKNKIFWSAYFMVGLPNESEEDILTTVKFMKELNPYYAALGVYSAMPNTALFDIGVKMGLLQDDVKLEHFFSTNPKDYFLKNPPRRVAYIEPARFNELSRFISNAFHQHNTKWGNLIRRGWSRRKAYFNDRNLLLSDIKKALSWVGIFRKNTVD